MAIGKLLANNKKAYHDFYIEDTIEAGIVLTGTEVKSFRAGKVSVKESYAEIKNGEVWIKGMHVAPYEFGNRMNPDPLRVRKLLLHNREIKKLMNLTSQKGYTIVPLRVYINTEGRMKVELGIARGKKMHDKRDAMSKRDSDMRLKREIKNRNQD
ncbi:MULTISPECIES: SsrA-binding protein SmpB [unclassified Fusibacter]|uniref:SsrA-binding protein SmpB n=1 Tax=unclassified Fusibacter TaxID=2624464 RepID=UPI001013258F|nr:MULTISPECIES: SsrA-binding protein SmpB [unclassified Fusibacter]MCK8059732.1 SsrA-binding protein SmpB [Fusibacter sp. A2]NPE21533.1 SsrA-binding protein SmpB [Fusibacter sp. A1]RXV61942.1 SsrA-binding protein SmpB [Fusibacter sp. A1]